MPQLIITLLKGDEHGTETDYRDNLPVNMSGVVKPVFGATGYMLQQPGLTQYGSAVDFDRGGKWNERQASIDPDFGHFRVSGNKLITVSASGTITELGTVAGNETVSLPYSFNTQAALFV